MLREYKVVSLDCKVSGQIPEEYRNDPAIMRALSAVEYRPLLRGWAQTRRDGLFQIDDAYNRRLEDIYWDMAQQAHVIAPSGEFVYDHIWCLGADGLRVDLANGVVFVGQAANWGPDYFKWWIETHGVGFDQWIDPNTFMADFGTAERRDDNIVMMKSPGYDIFGHWLLDFVPQLTMTQYMDLPPGTPFVYHSLTPWMSSLATAAGIKHFDVYQHRLTEHYNMRAPTGLKCGYALGAPINGMAWNSLRAHFNHLNCTRLPDGREKLFISRRKWVGQRALADYEALEQRMQELGFAVYHPEQFSLQDQAHVFSTSRIILGEDGSALHSIMLTNPGARLGVLMHQDRLNLWHAGICDFMGHRVAYHEIPVRDNVPVIDLDAIADFAERM